MQEFASRNRNVILTRSSTITGKGGAIKQGLGLAAATGGVLGFIEADRSIHPDDFLRLVDAIYCSADLAIGSRKLPGSVILQSQPLVRRVLGSAYVPSHAHSFRYPCTTFSADARRFGVVYGTLSGSTVIVLRCEN